MVDHLNIGVSTIPTDPQIPFNFLRKSDKMKSSRVEITHTKCKFGKIYSSISDKNDKELINI